MNPQEIDKMLGGSTSLSVPNQQNTAPQVSNQSTPQDIDAMLGGSTSIHREQPTEQKPFINKVGDFLGLTGVANDISTAVTAPKNIDLFSQAHKTWSDVSNNLIKAIKIKQQNGQDTTNLNNALQQHLQEAPQMSDFVDQTAQDTLNKTPEQVIGDVGQLGLASLSGGGLQGLGGTVNTFGSKILQGAKVGAGYSAVNAGTKAMQENKNLVDTAKDVAGGAVSGAVVGGAISGVGEGLKSLVDTLPNRLVRNAIPGLDKKGAEYVLENRKIGTVGKLFKDSAESVTNLNSQIDSILKHPDMADELLNTPKLFSDVVTNKYPDSNYVGETLIKTMKSLAPEKAGLVDKMINGTATLADANEVKKVLYARTKSVFTDTAQQTAKKQLGANIALGIADEIKRVAPETVPIFDKMSKEINLRNLLLKQYKKQDAQKIIGLYDLATAGLGHSIGGLPGAIGSEVGRKVLTNPATKFAGAKILNKIGKTKGLPTLINTLNKSIK